MIQESVLPQTPKLALGTVQFGLPYGVAGRNQPVDEPEVRSILEDAAERGVEILDTAAAYGDIEARLSRLSAGLDFKIISKVPAIPDALSPLEAARFALTSAEQSLMRLGSALSGILLHKPSDWEGDRGRAIAEVLFPWANSQKVSLGVSCYAPEELLKLSAQYPIELAQLPGNAFDQRVTELPLQQLDKVQLHLRSAFLQGLLLMPQRAALARIPAAKDALGRWYTHCSLSHRKPLAAALGIVKSFRQIRTVVVGVDSLSHWREIASTWSEIDMAPAPELASDSLEVIDPRRWPPSP